MSNQVKIKNVRVIHATEKALLVEIDGEKTWVPQSQIDDDSNVYKTGDEGTLIVTQWFADKQGWEDED